MISKTKGESRRYKLADYFFDLSKLSFSGAGLGGLSPMFTGEISVSSVYQLIFGVVMSYTFYFYANRILKKK